MVIVDSSVATRSDLVEREVVAAARDALLELLAAEAVPVSLYLRLTSEVTTVLARATPA
ncbi:MAG: hypothetical protein M1274_12125 [Actinobacteria bacterium]|nr:hypothetical protein [Actinomycetota bacterium]